MNQIIRRIVIVLTMLALPVISNAAVADTYTIKRNIPLTTQDDKFSYILGIDFAENFSQQEININPELLFLGLKAGMNNEKYRMTEEEMQEVLSEFQVRVTKNRQQQLEQLEAKLKIKAMENKKISDDYLEANKKKKHVITTKSGLQYRVIKKGKGKIPTSEDTIVVEYTGKLVDGTEFGSTASHGGPASFPLKGGIVGWQEALKMMPQGSKWEIVVPYNLAYGETGQGTIGPNQILIFEVELLEVK